MDMKKIMHDTLILFVICVISGLLLGAAYEITAPITAARKEAEKAETYKVIYVDAAEIVGDEKVTGFLAEQADIMAAAGITGAEIRDCMVAKDDSGNVIG